MEIYLARLILIHYCLALTYWFHITAGSYPPPAHAVPMTTSDGSGSYEAPPFNNGGLYEYADHNSWNYSNASGDMGQPSPETIGASGKL